jgi:hypothetical protein
MEEKKRYITIVSCRYYLFQHEYDYEFRELLTKGITDWVEVDDNEFNQILEGVSLLNRKHSTGNKDSWYILVEKQLDQKELIIKTIQEFKEHVKLVKQEEDKRIAEVEQKRLEKQKKQQDKEIKMKQRLFEQLRKEFEIKIEPTLISEEIKKEEFTRQKE